MTEQIEMLFSVQIQATLYVMVPIFCGRRRLMQPLSNYYGFCYNSFCCCYSVLLMCLYWHVQLEEWCDNGSRLAAAAEMADVSLSLSLVSDLARFIETHNQLHLDEIWTTDVTYVHVLTPALQVYFFGLLLSPAGF